MLTKSLSIVFTLATCVVSAHAGILQYGDQDLCNTGTYASDPTAGATKIGLLPDEISLASQAFNHYFPFAPTASDYAGTDQIYVGTTQTSGHDGYSGYDGRIHGPQIVTLDYSSLIPDGEDVVTFTLGLGADDFQDQTFGQPFTASVNGVTNNALLNALNNLNQTGPYTQYLTVGINPEILTTNHILTLSINEGGDGGDGWALDYLTIGITTAPVPEPTTLGLLLVGSTLVIARRNKR